MTKVLSSKKYVFQLFVAGATVRSANAIKSVKKVCNEHLKDNFDLTVIDIYQHPELARQEQIIAVPTLVKKHPVPLKRFIGDISDTERIVSRIK